MIKKFNKMNNLAVFNNFTWDDCVTDKNGKPATFEKLNIMYGQNYSGKTTLSRIVRALETHAFPEKYVDPQFEIVTDDEAIITQDNYMSSTFAVRVFNEDFVRTNLRFLIDPTSEIAPFAILGADNAAIEIEIERIKAEIGGDSGEKTGLYKTLDELSAKKATAESAYSVSARGLEGKLSNKASGGTTSIKHNHDIYGDINYNITKLKKDILGVTAPEYTQLTSLEKQSCINTVREIKKNPIASIDIPNLRYDDYLTATTEVLSRKIGTSNKISELLIDAALNEWVKQGAFLREGQKTCAFCGSIISDERWAVIHEHFDEESKLLDSDIDRLIHRIKEEIDTVPTLLRLNKDDFYAKYHTQVTTLVSATIEQGRLYCDALGSIVEQLQTRKAQITMSTPSTAPTYSATSYIEIFDDFNQLIKENNEFTEKLSEAQAVAQNALRLQEVADFCATIGYDSEVRRLSVLEEEYTSASKLVQETASLLDAKKSELQDKLRQLNDEEEGATRVNKYLNDYFGHRSLALRAEEVSDGEKRIRFSIMRNGTPAYNLSEGECSLVSFCYFLAKLDDVNTADTKPIIWIDDPISSLDGNHIFYVYSLISAEIVARGIFEQLFISTHNLDFLKYLKRLKKIELNENGNPKSIGKRYFSVIRSFEHSSIILMPDYLKNYATEFNYLFECIYKCAQVESVDDNNFELIYNLGNNARKFLEIYLYFKYPEFIEDARDNRLERFFGDSPIPHVLVTRFTNEYSHLRGSLERGGRPTEMPEFILAARSIVKRIREIDTEQYASLLRSIGVEEHAESE